MEGFEALLSLKDQVSGPSKSAAGAVKQLKEGMATLSKEIDVLKEKQLKYREAGMGKVAQQAGIEISRLKNQYSQLGKAAKELTPPVEKNKGVMADFTAGLGAEVAIGAVAAESLIKLKDGFLELVTWVITATVKLAAFGIQQSVMKDRMSNMYGLFRSSAQQGQETFEMVDAIGRGLNISADKVHGYAKDLLQAGVKPQFELQQSVKAIASLQSLGNEEAASKLKSIITTASASRQFAGGSNGRGMFGISAEDLRGTGTDMSEFFKAYAITQKVGVDDARKLWMRGALGAKQGIEALNFAINNGRAGLAARKQLWDLDTVFSKLRENFARLFQGLQASQGMQKFLGLMMDIVHIFDVTQPRGKAFQDSITNAFDRIFDSAYKALFFIIIHVQELIIQFLLAYIAMKPMIAKFKELVTSTEAVTVMKAALIGLIVIMGILAVTTLIALSPLIALIIMVGIATVALALIFGGLVLAVDWAITKLQKFAGMGREIAADLIDGLVGGIREGLAAISNVMNSLGDTVIGGLKKALGIASPSKEMAKLGVFAAQGFSQGLEAGAGDVGFTMSAPKLDASSKGNGPVINFTGDINITGTGGGVAQIKEMLEDEFTDLLERVALEYGR